MQPDFANADATVPTPMQPPLKVRKKASLNPFKHFIRGNKDMFATNFGSAMGVGIISAIAITAIVVLYILVGASLLYDSFSSSSTGISVVFKVIGFFIIYLLLIAALSSITNIALLHTLVASSKRTKVSIGQAFSFTFARFAKAFITNIVVVGIVFAAYIVFALAVLVLKSPIITLLGGLAMLVFVIIYSFRITYVNYILADDAQPIGPLQTIKRSSQLFVKSSGALVLYGIVFGLIIIVLGSVLGGSNKQPSHVTYNTNLNANYTGPLASENLPNNTKITASGAGTALTGVIIGSAIINLVSIVFIAGIAHIYAEAKEKLDGPTPLGGAIATGGMGGPTTGPMPVSAPQPVLQQYGTAPAPIAPATTVAQPDMTQPYQQQAEPQQPPVPPQQQ